MNSYLVREGRSHDFNIEEKDIVPSNRIKRTLDLRSGVTNKMQEGSTYLSIFDQL